MTTLVTIPNCSATHILGSTHIPLASGPLSLLKPPPHLSSNTASATQSTPVLTLQIDTLVFPLFKHTLFGTDASNPLVYLFAPELGPAGQPPAAAAPAAGSPSSSQSGYVKLELPEEANNAGSEAAKSQEHFEKALIAEGLLTEGEGDSGVAQETNIVPGSADITSAYSPSTHTFPDTTTSPGTAQSIRTANSTASNIATHAAEKVTSGGRWLTDTIANRLSAEGGGVPAEAIDEDPEDKRSLTRDVLEGVKTAAKGTSDLARTVSKKVGATDATGEAKDDQEASFV